MIKRLLIILFLFAFYSLCNAQITPSDNFTYTFSEEPLVKVLKQLKSDMGYRMAYKLSDVKDVSISEVFEEASIKEVLETILPDQLNFNIINDLVIIYRAEELGKGRITPTQFNFSLAGEIIDFFTGESLPYASLKIASTGVFHQSNQEGKFRIERYPSDTSTVVITYIGYRTARIRPNQLLEFEQGLPVVINLKPETTIINGVVIESYDSTPILSKKEAGLKFVNVLQIPQVTNVGEADALTLVKLLPGFDPSSESNLGLGTRGFRADENLYLLDGYAVFNPDHFFGLFSSLNSLSVKNIRVLKSAYEPEYGGRSSALFDITSYGGNTKKFQAKFKAGMLSTSARIDGPLFKNKINYSVAARTSNTSIFSSKLYENLFNSVYNSRVSLAGNPEEFDAFESTVTPDVNFSDIQAKISSKPSKTSNLSVSGFYGEDYSRYQITDKSQDSDFKVDYLNEFSWQNYGSSITFSHELSEKLRGKYMAAYSAFISQSNSLETIDFGGDSDSDRVLQSSNDNGIGDLTLKAKWDLLSSDSLTFNGGFEINDCRSYFNLSSFNIPISEESIIKRLYSVFGNIKISRAKYSLDVGIRSTYDQKPNEIVLEPRLKYSLDLNSRTSLKASYGRHNQFLRRLESLNFFRGALDIWRLSGENSLPRSVSDHIVMGLHYEYKSISLDLEGFSTWQQGAFEDLSVVLSPGNQNASNFVFGDAQTLGFEFTGQKNVKRNNFSVSYALMHSEAKYKNDENEIFIFENGRTPRHNLTGLWLWENDSFSFSVSSIFSSGKPYTPAIGSYVIELANNTYRPFLVFGGYNSALLPSYFRTDVSASWKTMAFKSISLEVSGSVQNLFDRSNVNFINYSVTGSTLDKNFFIFTRNVKHLNRLFSVYLTLKF